VTGIGARLWDAANRRPDHPFVRYESGESFTFSQQLTRSSGVVASLALRGIGRGERVVVMLDNEPEFLDVMFACALSGTVMVPINTKLEGSALESIVARARAAGIISSVSHIDAMAEIGFEGARLLVGDDNAGNGWDALGNEVPDHAAEPAVLGPMDPFSIVFTSGTTGRSKGATLSHAHCIARSQSYVDGLDIDETDVMYTCLPLFHNNAQMASVLVALLAGGTTVIYPRFSLSRFWGQIAAEGATRVTLIGRMANQLLELHEGEVPDHRLRTACIVPAPRGDGAFARRFGVRVVSQYYGSTEMIPMPPDLRQPERPGSCGRPSPDYECQVVDADGNPRPDGEVGELVVRPRHRHGMMNSYFDMPQETLHACRGLWFHTGDTMRRDEQGFYYLNGRLGDFIRSRGENVSAGEIEAIAEQHPLIAGAAAVGSPDEWGEEKIVLFAEVRDVATLRPEDVARFCAERLPDFMQPNEVIVVPELPRNALQRVEKHRLPDPRDARL
jgi:crotonobetaine/carnitine-CoA ligase